MIELNINGQSVYAKQGDTLLKAAQAAGIIIPSLCDYTHEQAKPLNLVSPHPQKHHCNLCVVEIKNSDNSTRCARSCETLVQAGMKVNTRSPQLTQQRQQALKTILVDHFADCEAPCQKACPAGVDIQSYLYHIAQGNHKEAVKVIKETLPLPLSIGRVCPAFCEAECRRGLVDEPLAIRQLKRHAADLDLNDVESYVPPRAASTGKRVAIIGGGPAGLSAGYYLSNNGHEVVIFDSMPKAGGWLRYGIPEYRLPKAILDKEIELLCKNGLKIATNVRLGRDIHLDHLVEDYDAVCLAIGAQKAAPMHYKGSDLDGCFLGVDYLRDNCTERKLAIGKKVAVIGGGNTAIDCARTALRNGADVTLIYRRTREDMPAEDYEIHEAEIEGVKFHLLTNPIENHADEHGRVSHITFSKMKLGEPDSSGRRSPIATDETFTEAFDTVIPAVSQIVDLEFMEHPRNEISTGAMALSRWNTFIGCEQTMSSGVEKLFVIGDARRGPSTAIEAVADGRLAAIAIDKQLSEGLTCELNPIVFNAKKAPKTAQLSKALYPNVAVQNRYKMPELTPLERLHNFSEVELGFKVDDAMKEAARCLECACQVNTDCRLRDYATTYKVSLNSEEQEQPARAFVVDKTAPFIQFDANRCISCGKCVDICHNQSGHNAICFESDHHHAIHLETPTTATERRAPRVGFSASMSDSKCVQCGNCVQVCPTGALVDARDKSQGRDISPITSPLKTTSTICTYCGVGCRLLITVDQEKNQIINVEGDSRSPVNDGMLCVKGRFGFDFINSKQRLTSPLIRKDGVLEAVSWQEAVEYIAHKLVDIKTQHGANAIAALASAKATNEDNFLLQKFVRTVIGTNNIDHCARLCHASTVSGLYDTLGSGAMTNDIPSINDSDLIFILGSDTTSAHPIIASKLKQAVSKGARLIVADPKKIAIADDAMLYVAQKPGTDVMLLNAIMQQILINNWHDEKYINERCEGFNDLKTELLKPDYALDTAATITGVSAQDIATIAKLIGTAQRTAIYYAMGITQHTTGHDNVVSIANLQLLCGNIGISGGGINPLRGQSNVQGSCDMGALPNYLSGYQQVIDPQVRAPFEQAWGVKLPSEIGISATEMMHAASHGTIKALYVMGENPVLSDPDQAHVIKGLQALDLLIVQDIFMTETAEFADVVLPAAAFAEKQGHFTNTERRVQRLTPALATPAKALPDWQIIQMIANQILKIDHQESLTWHYDNEKMIWDELTQLTPQYRGITWERLSQDLLSDRISGIHWPCPTIDHAGTPILHQTQFTRGKGKMLPVHYRLPAELPCEEYPLTLSTGRLLEQFHTGTLTRKTPGLDLLGAPRVMISVYDAEKIGIKNGDLLRLSTRRGEIEIHAFVTKRAQVGVLFLPFHFAESAANKLTNNVLDPIAKIPEFKVCSVKAEKVN